MAVSWNQGWSSIRVTKRCPTMPVPPMMPTLYFFMFRFLSWRLVPQIWTLRKGKKQRLPIRAGVSIIDDKKYRDLTGPACFPPIFN